MDCWVEISSHGESGSFGQQTVWHYTMQKSVPLPKLCSFQAPFTNLHSQTGPDSLNRLVLNILEKLHICKPRVIWNMELVNKCQPMSLIGYVLNLCKNYKGMLLLELSATPLLPASPYCLPFISSVLWNEREVYRENRPFTLSGKCITLIF